MQIKLYAHNVHCYKCCVMQADLDAVQRCSWLPSIQVRLCKQLENLRTTYTIYTSTMQDCMQDMQQSNIALSHPKGMHNIY
jgi:hypothetical protein